MRTKRNIWKATAITLAVLLTMLSAGTALAFTAFSKQLAATGNIEFVDEALVTDIIVKSQDRVVVQLESNVSTEADHIYTIELMVDDELIATNTATWAAGAIPGGKVKLTFTGLTLAGATDIDAVVSR